MKYDNNYYLNFSPRMQDNLTECGFKFIGEPQRHLETNRLFWVYEKTYELQLFLAMFQVNKNKLNSSYKDCQINKAFLESRLLNETSIDDYKIVENKFTKLK